MSLALKGQRAWGVARVQRRELAWQPVLARARLRLRVLVRVR